MMTGIADLNSRVGTDSCLGLGMPSIATEAVHPALLCEIAKSALLKSKPKPSPRAFTNACSCEL